MDAAEHAIKTWRYLRLAMIVLVAGLFLSVVVEWREVGWDCLQGSISAYYYTPVRAFFVAALVGIGVCMVSLKALRESEDTLLNLAGMLAPVVALVPTPGTGACSSSPAALDDRNANVFNNMTALLGAGLVALVLVAVLTARDRRRGRRAPQRAALAGMVAAAVVWAVAVAVFVVDRDLFRENAHYAAALLMFGCIIAVVLLNAVDFARKETAAGRSAPGRSAYANRYAAVAAAMGLSVVVMVGYRAATGWEHVVLGLEAALILLFAVFWTVQTEELWEEGLRVPRDAHARPTLPAPRPSTKV